nr:hypothetical protein [Tanacetum cinerariifolium]
MEQAVEQHCVEKNKFQHKMNNVLKDNERLLEQAISVDIVNIVMHDHVNSAYKTVNVCERCVPIETELQKDFIKKEVNLLSSASGSQPQCNTKNDRIQQAPNFDELTTMASEQSSSGPSLNEMTPAIISSGLVQKSSSSTHYVPPSRNDCDLLFQPMFDELLNPPPSVDNQASKVIAPIADVIPPVQADSTGSPSSTTVDQDAPSPIAHMGNDSLFGVPIPEATSAQSSSTDHLYSACAMGKSKKKSHKTKFEDTNLEKLYLLHMDLCGPMRVESVNGKKYILVIVDDYSRFTWVKCLRSKDEAPDFIIKFLKMIQVRLKMSVRHIRTDNGTEFVNQTLREYHDQVGISNETSVARSLQQNGVVERRNRTLIEAARTMLIMHKLRYFYRQRLWLPHVTPKIDPLYEFIMARHHMSFCMTNFLIYRSFTYLVYSAIQLMKVRILGKLQPKADIGIFIGYAPTKKAFRIYNRRTRRIIETIHVDFDELTAMASEQSSSGPHFMK